MVSWKWNLISCESCLGGMCGRADHSREGMDEAARSTCDWVLRLSRGLQKMRLALTLNDLG